MDQKTVLKKAMRRAKWIGFNFRYYWNESRRYRRLDLPALTREEKRAIRRTWEGFTIIPADFICARVYKKVQGFSPYYLAPCWYMEVRQRINPRLQLYALGNKAMCDLYFPEISFPEPYVRKLNGSYYDKAMNCLSLDQAVALLREKKEFILKPALGSLVGRGVSKVDCATDDVEAALRNAGPNSIAQEVLGAAPEIERLNPSSVNCIRVTSIYLNGRYASAAMVKVAREENFRDNWRFAYLVGVDAEGRLADCGYDIDMNPVDRSDSGVVFKGYVIPRFREITDHLEQMHRKYFPQCAVVGWDVTLDRDYRVRVVEANLFNTGTNAEQYVSGAFFEPFRDDFVAIMKR
ncbi:MAG: hypothetical protein J5702_06280 [Bacteroidales bacterium]|nr:hypothetical protein [Bacteroidales bacterium]